jgi:hypothetical protein
MLVLGRHRIDGVFFEDGAGDVLEGGFVGGLEDDLGGEAEFPRFFPARGAEAPLVAGLESGEIEIGHGGGEVVALGFGEGEERFGSAGADGVAAGVFGACGTGAVAVETGEGVDGAGLEFGAEDVFVHEWSEDGWVSFLCQKALRFALASGSGILHL